MGILDLFKSKKKEIVEPMQTLPEIREERKQEVTKSVHDDKNKFTAHMIKVNIQAKTVDESIEVARKNSKKLQRMLTVTEKLWISQGGKVYGKSIE